MDVRSNPIFRTNLLDQFTLNMMGHCTVLHLHADMQSLYAEKFKLLGNSMSVEEKKGFFEMAIT